MFISIYRYVIFYSPFDVGYKIAKFLPIKVLLAAMKEVYRLVYNIICNVAMLYVFDIRVGTGLSSLCPMIM